MGSRSTIIQAGLSPARTRGLARPHWPLFPREFLTYSGQVHSPAIPRPPLHIPPELYTRSLRRATRLTMSKYWTTVFRHEVRCAASAATWQFLMAENETLDLRQSPRWKPARRLLREGAAPEALAQEVFRAVDATLKKLAKLIPIGRLIDQSLRLDGQPRELLPDCRGAAEYAQAIIQLARHCETPSGVVASVLEHLSDHGLETTALQSVSCARLPRRFGYRQCGVCAACITRRQALAVAGIREPQGEYEFDIFSRGRSQIPPITKQEDLKAVLNQVLDFGAIGPSLLLTPRLKQWLLGTGIIAREQDAKPWLAVLWRYHCEWLRLAQAHRGAAVSWAERLLEHDNERYAHASGR